MIRVHHYTANQDGTSACKYCLKPYAVGRIYPEYCPGKVPPTSAVKKNPGRPIAREEIRTMMRSIAERAGLSWNAGDDASVDKFFDELELEMLRIAIKLTNPDD